MLIHFSVARRLLSQVALILPFFGGSWAVAQTPRYALDNADHPLDISTTQDADEELLLVTALEHAYISWPQQRDKDKFLAALEEKRSFVTSFRGAINASHLDPRVNDAVRRLLALDRCQ
jgi:hypothetical protein